MMQKKMIKTDKEDEEEKKCWCVEAEAEGVNKTK